MENGRPKTIGRPGPFCDFLTRRFDIPFDYALEKPPGFWEMAVFIFAYKTGSDLLMGLAMVPIIIRRRLQRWSTLRRWDKILPNFPDDT